MNKQQLIAYQNPCFEAVETTSPIFRQDFDFQKFVIRIILTVNIGLEWAKFFQGRALWHCSASIREGFYSDPKLVSNWNKYERKQIEKAITDTLKNVGDITAKHIEFGSVAIHFRRPLSFQEETLLPRKGQIYASL